MADLSPDVCLLSALREMECGIRAVCPTGRIWLVLDGDWGGQIYLTIPWEMVGTGANIQTLLRAMDQLAWGCNQEDGASARLVCPDYDLACLRAEAEARGEKFDAADYGDPTLVDGGMGGGRLTNGLWLHGEFLGEPVSLAQDMADEICGATCDEVRAMNWPTKARELLDLREPPAVVLCG